MNRWYKDEKPAVDFGKMTEQQLVDKLDGLVQAEGADATEEYRALTDEIKLRVSRK